MKKYLLLTFTLLLLAVLPVSAEEKTFTIVPPTMSYSVKQNDKFETKVKVRNETDAPLTFKVFIRDFIVEDKLGTPKILAPDEANNRWSAAKWMTVLPDTFTASPRSSFESMLYVQIPGDATFGGHYAAVIFQPDDKISPDGTGASIITQSVSLVYLNILGPITENSSVSLFEAPIFSEYGPIKFKTEIQNLGDVHVKPIGAITIKDLFGRTLTQLTLPENNVFPGTIKTYENIWPKKWLIGKFTADLAGVYGQNNNLPLAAMVTFYVFPVKIALALLLCVVIIILLAKYLKNNRPSPPSQTA